MNKIEAAYLARMDALTPKEKIARSVAMFEWSREVIGRQLIKEHGAMKPEELKWRIALRQYGADPEAARLIEKVLRIVSS